jgi:DNA-binding NarL/FixJ family response regulator
VFALLVHGVAPKDMAALLRISHTTVRRHAEDVYRKCGVRSQRETLALFARTIMGGGMKDESDSATRILREQDNGR